MQGRVISADHLHLPLTLSYPSPILQATSYYYEVQLLQCGDTPDDQGGNVFSFGLAPPAPTNSSTSWTNPSGTVLFHSNGRAYHYCGPTILAWKSIRLNCSVKVTYIGFCYFICNLRPFEITRLRPSLIAQEADRKANDSLMAKFGELIQSFFNPRFPLVIRLEM